MYNFIKKKKTIHIHWEYTKNRKKKKENRSVAKKLANKKELR